MQDAVRQELRGSDVLGTMNGDRVAALLTHTDGAGSNKVVGRLRRTARRSSDPAEPERRSRRACGVFAGVQDGRSAPLAGGEGCAAGLTLIAPNV